MKLIIWYLLGCITVALLVLFLWATSADHNQPECQGTNVPAICVQ